MCQLGVGDAVATLDIDMDCLILARVSLVHWTGCWTVSPLTLATHMNTIGISQGGAPGLAIVSIHQDTASVLDILVGEGEHTVGSTLATTNCHTRGGGR